MKSRLSQRASRTFASAAVFAVVVSATFVSQAQAQPRFVNLSSTEIAARSFDDQAAILVAAIRDASFGPTVALIDGLAVASLGDGALRQDGTIELAAVDVDHRPQRTNSASAQTRNIARVVPLSAAGNKSVEALVSSLRAIEETATAGRPELDIVKSTVEVISASGIADQTNGTTLVEVKAYVTETYRTGVTSEGIEQTNLVFNSETGAIQSVVPLSEQALTATSPVAITARPESSRGTPADPTYFPEGQVPFEIPRDEPFSSGMSRVGLPMSMTSTQRSAVVTYATTYWSSYNSSYRSFDNDCTNFVSQAMRAGGWSDSSGWYQNDNYWWYNSLNQTFSWAGAENWYKFARVNSGRVAALSYVYSLRAGDVLQVKYSGDTAIHHSMIVDSYSGGEVYLTYHSNNRYHKSFSWYSAQYSGETYFAQQV